MINPIMGRLSFISCEATLIGSQVNCKRLRNETMLRIKSITDRINLGSENSAPIANLAVQLLKGFMRKKAPYGLPSGMVILPSFGRLAEN